MRAILVPDKVEDCGLRKMGLRRSTSEPDVWEIYVSAHNYGSRAARSQCSAGLRSRQGREGRGTGGGAEVHTGAGGEQGITFRYRTRAAGLLEATLLPHDAFPDDDRAIVEVPEQPALAVTVYSDQPELLRPVLAANPTACARPTGRLPNTGPRTARNW